MHDKLTLRDLPIKGKRVLMRVDFNVPLDATGAITDDTRIREALPSIQYVLQNGATQLVLMSHLGRPEGVVDARYSLAPCAKRLSELLHQPVSLVQDFEQRRSDRIVLLENVRFYPGEEKADPAFAELLARWGDVYVDDAFGSAHRAHSSIVGVAALFPGRAAAGFLMQKELHELGSLLDKPERPFYAIVGGAKILSKLGVLKKLVERVDGLFIGGAMAYHFEERAPELVAALRQKKIPYWLPVDHIVAEKIEAGAKWKAVQTIPTDWVGVDIGPKTVQEWSCQLSEAKTIFWNGPVGVCEIPPFDAGTRAIAKALADAPARVIIGGGDSVAAINKMGLSKKFAHLSTGGGAALELLEFGSLPGIEALSNRF